ncbi:hypothetical protein [Actinorugispora endophytica]|uniref:Uncharacterized protein n=1 Tax=Actinorugispora endophytica TaxID=1605990 RepID=A0A4R6VDY5_9ACTN|nr:hypothetical protein [Actinorugispora endophytica]TDQ55237.1 hypothetical protein EV190_101562 [Actinorugispora endophytica]
MADQQLPEEWPAGVRPPWAEDFAESAAEWLFDLVPADYRLHGVLRRHPVALSRLALRHVEACLEAAREGYRTARVDLGGHVPPPVLDQVMHAYLTEGRRLAGALRAVGHVDGALRAASPGTTAG